MTELSDEELYSRLATEPQRAFRILYERHSGPLFRFIYRFTVNRQSAEEILHDIFTQLLTGSFQSREDAHLKNWLYTLAKNKSMNHFKKSRHEIGDTTTIEGRQDATDLEAQAIEENLLEKLALSVKSLPDDLQETWQLRRQGFDYQQIAKALAIPLGTVKSRFHRLVEHLKKEFN